MGFCRDEFGRVSIESHGDGFTIHADYGFASEIKPLKDLDLGDTFYFTEEDANTNVRYQLISLHLDGKAYYKPADEVMAGPGHSTPSHVPVVWCYYDGSPNLEEFEDSLLGRQWREESHPVFFLEDLDNLIKALQDYKESL